jgi:uncharacterized protein (DUF488 family)
VNIIYTIGYEGTDIDRFIATLKAVGIKTLVDIRAVALSRKKGFSKSHLRARLSTEGISYEHLIELGDPKPGRDAARAGRYGEFRRLYTRHLDKTEPMAALRALTKIVRATPTCLLCFERDPTTCHRSIVADRLKSKGTRICNLYGDDPGRYGCHPQERARRYSCEGIAAP